MSEHEKTITKYMYQLIKLTRQLFCYFICQIKQETEGVCHSRQALNYVYFIDQY